MSIPTKLALALLVILLACVFLVYHFHRPSVPGSGRPAEIIDPVTHERHATTWDRVLENPEARLDASSGGGWMVPVPGVKPPRLGYVVNAGQRAAAEDEAPAAPDAPGSPR